MELDRMSESEGAIGPLQTSAVFKQLKISPIKALYPYYNSTNINLAGGIPLESCFPFNSLKVNLDAEDGDGDGDSFTLTKGSDLALNYHSSDGLPPVKAWVHSHVQELHAPPFSFDVSLTVGATDAWFKVLQLLHTECVLFDEYVYASSITYVYASSITPCTTAGIKAIGIESDAEGMKPASIRAATLRARGAGLVVNILYLIPVGQNPTGLTMSQARKGEIYSLCGELDLIIVEDDAYYYLHYPDGQTAGLDHLPPSLLSMDVDGRVIRIDTVSKIISPGMRLGWVSGPPDFIAKFVLLQGQSNQFPSSIAQSIFLGLVQHWGRDGLNAHIRQLQLFYKSQRDVFCAAIEEHFQPGLCVYSTPQGGMFLWLTFPTLRVTTWELFEALAAVDVIVVPGTGFHVPAVEAVISGEIGGEGGGSGRAVPCVPCVRACYAAVGAERIVQAAQSMAACVLRLHSEHAEHLEHLKNLEDLESSSGGLRQR
ncbi:pyridoxal phosphate-dependent transferase [Ochromonadaceae sp. CCMP2298]|nr:pyridoxal phosphate-dependent transferase [Ochromonadaceae sp. CCMP2298]